MTKNNSIETEARCKNWIFPMALVNSLQQNIYFNKYDIEEESNDEEKESKQQPHYACCQKRF